MAGLLDFLQSASNSAASNVSGPVDLLAWALKKAGVPVGNQPMLGSAWMEQQGLTKPVPQSAMSLAGETAGLLAPIGIAAKAPQIAAGMLQGQDLAKQGAMAVGRQGADMASDYMARSGLAPRAVSDVDVGYRGGHTAPTLERGNAPLHDLTKTYPDDIYSANGARYYGHYGDARDNYSIGLMQKARGNPDMLVDTYRAVPKYITPAEQIKKIESDLAKYNSRRVVPKEFGGSRTKIGDEEGFLKWSTEQLEKLRKLPPGDKVQINSGDWVTINPAYAREHAQAQFGKDGRILKARIPARKLFTDGNSIHEFGYDAAGVMAALGIGLPLFSGSGEEGQ